MASAAIGLAAGSVLGGMIAAGGAEEAANAKSAAYNFNAQVDEQNAQIYLQQGRQQAVQDERSKQQAQGQVIAAAGASGVTEGGSALDVLSDVAGQHELQKQYDIYQSKLKARGAQNKATLARFGSSEAQIAGQTQAASDLIGGATSGAQTYFTLS